MRTLILFEAKKVARNPLVWLGSALLFGIAVVNAKSYWASVPNDAEWAHSGLFAIAPFAILVGAWIGLRDRTSGADGVVAPTPLRGKGLVVPARMAAVAVVALAACTLAFGANAVYSMARGGRGLPDAFLVLDAGLYVALAACGGFAIGHLSGSRILSLLAAPILPGIVFYFQGTQSGSVTDPSWLLPNPLVPTRFGPLGYLPDIFPMHSAYLACALVALVGIVWLTTGRAEGATSTRVATALVTAGAIAFVACAGWLAVQPDEVHVSGSDPSEWVEIHSPADYDLLRSVPPADVVRPFAAFATECAEVDGVRACVFPEYGPSLAQAMAESAAPLAGFRSLGGVPQEVRMVPSGPYGSGEQCVRGEVVYVGSWRIDAEFREYMSLAESGFYCAVYGPRQLTDPVANALHAWFSARVARGYEGARYVRLVRNGWGRRATETVRHLADVPVAEVVTRLEPIWDEVRDREATLAEVRDALGA